MGKYHSKTQVQKTKKTTNANEPKMEAKKGKGKKVKNKARKAKVARNRALNEAKKVAAAQDAAALKAAGGGPVSAMSDSPYPVKPAGEKTIDFLRKARSDAKAFDATKKLMSSNTSPEGLAGGLCHLSGRGLTACVEMMLEKGVQTTYEDKEQPEGRRTPLQLAASRGHVGVVRLLCRAEADRTGALEAAQDLAKLGPIFMEERQAIQACLKNS